MESFRRIALTVVVFVLAGSASLNAQAPDWDEISILIDFGGEPRLWVSPDPWITIDNLVKGQAADLGDGFTLTALDDGFMANGVAPPRVGAEYDGVSVPQEARNDYLFKTAAFLDPSNAAGTTARMRIDGLPAGNYNVTVFEGRTTDGNQVAKIWTDAEPRAENTGNFAQDSATVEVTVGAWGESLWYKHLEDNTGGVSGMIIRQTSQAVEDTPANTIIPLDAAPRGKGTGLDGRYWQAGVRAVKNLKDIGLKIITGSRPTGTFKATHLNYQGGNDLTPVREWLRNRNYIGGDGNMADGVLSFTGYIRIDTPPKGIAPGEVAIRSESDDGSMVWIAGKKVVDNDGRHDAPGPTPDGTYNFETPGLYPIEIAWFNSDSTNAAGDHGDASLNVLVNGKPIPKGVLYRAGNVGGMVAMAASSITEETGDAGLAGAYWHVDQGGLEFDEGPRLSSQGYLIRSTPILQLKSGDDQGLMMLETEPQGRFISTNVSYTGDDLLSFLDWLRTDSKSFTGIEDDLEDGLVQFKGFINIKKGGQHDFRCASDDGAVVWIGNQRVVNNDGGHATPGPTPDGSAFFPVAGLYPIEVAWFNAGVPYDWVGGASISLKMDGRSIRSLLRQPFAGAVVPTLSIARNADGTLTVTFEGKLQGAPTVNGPWRDSGVTSPVTIRPAGKTLFGRAVSEGKE